MFDGKEILYNFPFYGVFMWQYFAAYAVGKLGNHYSEQKLVSMKKDAEFTKFFLSSIDNRIFIKKNFDSEVEVKFNEFFELIESFENFNPNELSRMVHTKANYKISFWLDRTEVLKEYFYYIEKYAMDAYYIKQTKQCKYILEGIPHLKSTLYNIQTFAEESKSYIQKQNSGAWVGILLLIAIIITIIVVCVMLI